MKNVLVGRRQFLKHTILLSCALIAPKTLFAQQLNVINSEDTKFLRVVIVALLDGINLTEKDIQQIISNVDQSIHRMPLATQDELKQLFWLMRQRFFKVVFAGVWGDWSDVDPKKIQQILSDWQQDPLGLGVLDIAYLALHDLCLGAWYSSPNSWAVINYPGAPKL